MRRTLAAFTYRDFRVQWIGACSSAIGTWMQIVDSNLSRFRGIGQVAASAEQMKGMPVGTVARIQETGDVPLDEARADLGIPPGGSVPPGGRWDAAHHHPYR